MANHRERTYEYTNPVTGETRRITLNEEYELTPKHLEQLGVLSPARYGENEPGNGVGDIPFAGPMRWLYFHDNNNLDSDLSDNPLSMI